MIGIETNAIPSPKPMTCNDEELLKSKEAGLMKNVAQKNNKISWMKRSLSKRIQVLLYL